MIDVSELIENLVRLLRDIPELVLEMNGDPERIYCYHDQYPRNASLAYAVHEMPAPSVMVAWQGTVPGAFGGNDVWKHQLAVYLRARETFEGDPPAAYYRMFRFLTKGVPVREGAPMLNVTVHPSCYPMDLPSIERQTDAEGLDYFQVAMTFTEIGDD
jgi:hypothetical protein